MQLIAVTEIITHFIGLFRIWDEPIRNWVKPDGAGREHPISLADGHAHDGSQGSLAVESTPSAPHSVREPSPGLDAHLHAWRGVLNQLPAHPQVPTKLAPFNPPDGPAIDAGAAFPPGISIPSELVSEVSIGWQGADQTIIDDHQVNMLIAHVSYVDDPSAGALPVASDAPIVALIAQSYATIPQDAPGLGQSDSRELGTIKAFEDGLASGSVAAQQTLHQGIYTDSDLTSPVGDPVAVTLPVTDLSIATPTANGVPLGQSIIMGHEIAGNAALIVDTSAAPLTQIVEGNAFHADLIVQSNVVQNIDQVSISAGAAIAATVLSDDNTIHNTARFEQLPNVFSTPVGASFGQPWNVQVVNGDFYDINAVTQQNVLINDTLYAGTPTVDHYYAVLGANTQLNAASITHDAPSYDLLIVLGNSYSVNAIYQNNVLLNDTKTGVEVSSTNDGTNTITTGHNTVTNDASITEYGTHSWNPTNADIQSLVHSLITNGAFSGSFPALANFGGTINVELVTGNYYNFNLISQTNVVANSSVTLADLTKAGLGVPTQLIVGQSTLTNSAAIVTAGPLSAQYVAGKPYETAMLVQSNIVTAHTDIKSGPAGALVPELVAFLDPGNAHDVVDPSASGHNTLAPASAHQDVLAGHLH